MVRHFGVLKFKEDITDEQKAECFASMDGMMDKIPGLLHLEHGPYSSGEGLNDGFTHGWLMTFESPESRDGYLSHPVHDKVRDMFFALLERVIIFDIVV